VSNRAERRLRGLREKGLNFEPRPVEEYTPARGWHADALSQPLPRGSWEVARRLVEAYCMADPALVQVMWDHDAPLLGRDMLLKLRLYRVLSVYAGVRVTRVWDETREDERVWGFEYGTLTGHIERGRMDYEVRERGDGAVDFRIHAHSRPSGEGLPWVRLGFRLFGRREQLRFYARCCERIARLSARELGLPDDRPPPASRIQSADTPDVGPLPERLTDS
jgi:uncharacterized protein (UPF0548 family)